MTLHLHISSPISNEIRTWLSNHFFVSLDENNWLDCTHFIRDFHTDKMSDFVMLINEATGIDFVFDKWELRY